MADILISPFANLRFGEPAIRSEKNRVAGTFEQFLVWPDLLENQARGDWDGTMDVEIYAPFQTKDFDLHRYIARVFLGHIPNEVDFKLDEDGNATDVELTLLGEYEDHRQSFEKIALAFASEYGDFLTRDHGMLKPKESGTGRFLSYPRLRSWFYEWADISHAVLKLSVDCAEDLAADVTVKTIDGSTQATGASTLRQKMREHTRGDVQVKRSQVFTSMLPHNLAGYCWLLLAREIIGDVEYHECSRRFKTACNRRSDEVMCNCTLPSSAPSYQSGNKIVHCCDRCRWSANKEAKSL